MMTINRVYCLLPLLLLCAPITGCKEDVALEADTIAIRSGNNQVGLAGSILPVRLEVGPRDIASDSVFVGRRDKGPKQRYGQGRLAHRRHDGGYRYLPCVKPQVHQGYEENGIVSKLPIVVGTHGDSSHPR